MAESTSNSNSQVGTVRVKRGLADMLRGGVIMDVVTPAEAKIAEDAGAVAVMALERVPADIRRDGGVARASAGGETGRANRRHGRRRRSRGNRHRAAAHVRRA